MHTGYKVRTVDGFRYVDEGGPEAKSPVLLLHGMLGEVGNWEHTIGALRDGGYRVLVPILPIYTQPLRSSNLAGLVEFVVRFLDSIRVKDAVTCGNSLGGHIALLLAIRHPSRVRALVLAGASGIYEVDMGQSVMRRRDREYLKERTAVTFFDPRHVTEELIDDVYRIVNDRSRALRLIRLARSVQAESLIGQLSAIRVPTQLIWGREDAITPPDVAETFKDMIADSELHWVERCGHTPMMEHPEEFNRLVLDFLARAAHFQAVA
jgi:2-hydroxy-6-oxonona-2,4-dienedioate hydrolase